ncbi:MAG TPA: two-component regulator propeller domain-containing protein [Chitinophagaceae bacterium]|nr:two-component regulator propeller domain-containing protein [Chitinophagaceae bacterium]
MKLHVCCCFIFFVALGCQSESPKQEQDAAVSFKKFPLNLNGGYRTNYVKGEPVKFIINQSGDTVKTGVPLGIKGKILATVSSVKPAVLKAGVGHSEQLITNTYLLRGQMIEKPFDPVLIEKPYDSSATVQLDIHPRKVNFKQPDPVKALPLRFKDNARFNIQYLDVEQGLGSSYVYSILQDSRGRLWFGTDGAGVNVYDGQYFIPYTEKQGLTNNVVSVVFEDSKGKIWMGTQHGITIYDGKNFYQITKEMGLLNDEILDIMEDGKGNIWIATLKGAYKLSGAKLSIYTVKNGLVSDNVRAIMEDEQGKLWFATDRGISVFDGQGFIEYHKTNGLVSDNIFCMLKARNGDMWFGSTEGICSFDGRKFRHYFKHQGLVSDYVWSFLEDEKANIWIGSYGGVSRFDGKSFVNFTKEEGLSNNGVRQLIKDRNGNIWWGTDGGGVNMLRTGSFVHMANHPLSQRKIRSMIQDRNGVFWFGSDGNGISSLKDDKLTNYTLADGLPIMGGRALLEDRKGNLWIGYDGKGVSKYDGKYFTHYLLPGGMEMNIIRSIAEDNSGNLWFGTYGAGLLKFDGRQFLQFNEKDGFSSDRIISLLIDSKGNLWIGSEGGGLSKYDGKKFTHFSEKEGLPSNKVFSLAEDSAGNIWIGTAGGGVCKFDGSHFTYLTEHEGLSNNNVWSIKEDHKGRYWFGTDNGLTLALPRGDEFDLYRYGVEDGLKSADFNLRTVWEDGEHRIWWGMGKGLSYLDLDEFNLPEDLLNLQFSFLTINGRAYDFRSDISAREKISFSDIPVFSRYPLGLTLPYNQNHLTFHFAATDWQAPHQIRYSYRLKGLDDKWSTPSPNALAEYRNLSYGNYVFEVKAMSREGTWTTPQTYFFRILPAWWQTWWFRALELLLLATLISLFSRYIYLNKLRKQREAMERQLALQYERQRISSEMHDDIGAGLSGVKLMAEMAGAKIKDEEERNEVLRIYQSLGAISSRMKEVIWSLNVENDDLPSLVSFIQKQARQLMEAYPCELTVVLPERIPDIEIDGESRRNIFLLVKESLHNIIKHSRADKVSLSIACSNELLITIRDNGHGFEYPSKLQTGNGLRNMKRRIEAVHGRMQVISDHGTTIKLGIPLKQYL